MGDDMQALRILVVVMGVMIVGGMVTLVVLLAQKMGGPPVGGTVGGTVAVAGSATLDEPAGTQIVAAVPAGDAVALHLRGGGPDRVVMVEARTGRVLGRIALAR